MKVIQSLGWYFPDSTGGTEVYVASLSRQLQKLGVSSSISAALDDSSDLHYTHHNTRVYRYPVLKKRNYEQRVGIRPHGGFDKFKEWLRDEGAVLYHQHSWTYGCGLHHLQAAKLLGMVTVLTVHVPGYICLRGTMLRDGASPCDGQIELEKCSKCWLLQRGVPSLLSAIISQIPPAFGGSMRRFGRLGTVISATSLSKRHLETLLEAISLADHVVAVCQWLYDVLLINGVPRTKLSLNRQGVAYIPSVRTPISLPIQENPLIVGYLGRWDPLKGIDVIVRAVLQLPSNIPLQLHIHAVSSNDPDAIIYMNQITAIAATSTRIKILPPLAPDAVAEFLQSIDLLAVPSQCFETGPLVVLEAFAVGTPVIGSDLGGISELVQHGQNGWLVDYNDTAAWAEALRILATDRVLLQSLQQGIGPVRTMNDVALETKELYLKLLADSAN